MEKKWGSKSLLPEKSGLTLISVEASGSGWLIQAQGGRRSRCPVCGVESIRRHSTYWRTIRDLPVQGVPVTLRLQVGRWRCQTDECERKIFTERLPVVTAPYGQRTERLNDVSGLVAYSLGGRPAERLMSRLGMAMSDDTFLRLIKRRARSYRSAETPLRVVGIDDWAWKKGHNYGTILVDLERRKVVDLLPDRCSQQVAQWLAQHSEVEFVSRDRFGLYAQASQQGSPQAEQITDRFHLLMNLKEAVEQELSRQRNCLVVRLIKLDHQRANEALSTVYCNAGLHSERAMQDRAILVDRRKANQALFETIHRLYASGKNVTAIARETGIGRKRVDKWRRLPELPERNKMAPKEDSPAYFQDYLARRWRVGCHHLRTLMAELRQQGYTGCFSGLARFVSRWRERQPRPCLAASSLVQTSCPDETSPMRHVSSIVAAALLIKPRPFLTAAQVQKVNALKKACPVFAPMRSLVMRFRSILRGGKPETLDCWIQDAMDSEIYPIRRFAKRLCRDLDAVRNALLQPFSNGPVEGHVNRLKTLKRQMYGRAGFELLRARLLPLYFPTSPPVQHQA
jgi:transposase